MDIEELLKQSPKAAIAGLKKKTIKIKAWAQLEREYNPDKHDVMTNPDYQVKMKGGKREQLTKVTLGLQKLAVKRMTELLFAIPVTRVYKATNEQQQMAAKIWESVYKKNRIDSVNKERAKSVYASQENITIWYLQEQPAIYGGQKTEYKLRCRNYSPMKDGIQLFPLFDEYDDLVALSISYSREDDGQRTSYFDTYTADRHIRWATAGDEWAVDADEEIQILKIPGVYVSREEGPIWEEQTRNVEEIEWTLSRQGNYIRKNSRPTWVIFSDQQVVKGNESNKPTADRNVLQYPANAKAGYQTWQAGTETTKFHVEELKREFFMGLQLPDMSMENMKAVAMSGESRKMMFIDAQMKAGDESGIWQEALDREANIIREYLKIMFPDLAQAFDDLEVENIINPFQINDDGERISNLTSATGGKQIMSQKTAIQQLGWVEDIEEELKLINEENETDLFEDPTGAGLQNNFNNKNVNGEDDEDE